MTRLLTLTAAAAVLPQFVGGEFDAILECGILAHGFLRLGFGDCGQDRLIEFSYKRRGVLPVVGRPAHGRRRRTG